MGYVDFAIKLEPRKGRGRDYPVLVLESPAGEGRGILRAPFDSFEIGSLLEGLGLAVFRTAQARLRDQGVASGTSANSAERSPKLPNPREVGGKLFNALFTDPVRDLFQRSLGAVESAAESGLRLALHFDPANPDISLLASLPWELLYWEERREYLCLGTKSPIVRRLYVPRPSRPLCAGNSFRILVASACPAGHEPLSLAEECQRIEQALTKLPQVQVEIIEHASPMALRDKLQEQQFHVVHFIGHGGFDDVCGVGTLLLEGEGGRETSLSGESMAALLRDFASIRLVFLNSCNSGRSSRHNGLDPFAGAASALVMAGLPAVVAMQFPISDEAALAFSSAFYRRLAVGDSVDRAVVEGRMAIHLNDPTSLEWATPVLFLRRSAGLLLEPGSDKRRLGTSNALSGLEKLISRLEALIPLAEKRSPTGDQEKALTLGEALNQLENLLQENEWKAADYLTGRIMLTLSRREDYGWLDIDSLQRCPLNLLTLIDRLWITHSRGRFGYSVQRELFIDLCGKGPYTREVWEKFGAAVGWFEDGRWLLWGEMTFSLDAPNGHLPDGFVAVQEEDGTVVRRWVLALVSMDTLPSAP